MTTWLVLGLGFLVLLLATWAWECWDHRQTFGTWSPTHNFPNCACWSLPRFDRRNRR